MNGIAIQAVMGATPTQDSCGPGEAAPGSAEHLVPRLAAARGCARRRPGPLHAVTIARNRALAAVIGRS